MKDQLDRIETTVKEIRKTQIADGKKIVVLETKVNIFTPLIAIMTGIITWFAKLRLGS